MITNAKRELLMKMMKEVEFFFDHLLYVVPSKDDILEIGTDLDSAKNCSMCTAVTLC